MASLCVEFRGILGFYRDADYLVVLFPNVTEPEKLRLGVAEIAEHHPRLCVCQGRVEPDHSPLFPLDAKHVVIRRPEGAPNLSALASLPSLVALVGSNEQLKVDEELATNPHNSSDYPLLISRVRLKPGQLVVDLFEGLYTMEYTGRKLRMARRVFYRLDDVDSVDLELYDLADSSSGAHDPYTIHPQGGRIELRFQNHPEDAKNRDFVAHYNIIRTPQLLNGRFPNPIIPDPPFNNAQCSPIDYGG